VLLRGADGSELELHLLGYRFPADRVDPWDSNALVVALRTLSDQGSWRAVDPCLTTWEAAHLVRWLVRAALDPPGAGPARLVEPNLELAAWPTAADGHHVHVLACFELEVRPSWLGPADKLCVELDVERRDLALAALELHEELERFPQRGDDPTL
jgi:hypothetical protein